MATSHTVAPSFQSSKSLSVVSFSASAVQITQSELVLFLSLKGQRQYKAAQRLLQGDEE